MVFACIVYLYKFVGGLGKKNRVVYIEHLRNCKLYLHIPIFVSVLVFKFILFMMFILLMMFVLLMLCLKF